MNCLVNIDVDDLPRAVRFFQAAFDLRPARRLGDGVVEMLGSAAPIYLLAKPAGSPSHAACAAGESPDARRYDRHWTPVHLDFVVDDLDAAIERAISAGAVLEKPPATQACSDGEPCESSGVFSSQRASASNNTGNSCEKAT